MNHSANIPAQAVPIPAQAIPVWNALKNAFEQGRFPQMLLLDGLAGVGKKLLAMNLAKMLCENGVEPEKRGTEPVIWLIPIDGKAEERDVPAKIDAKTLEYSQKFIQNPFHTGYITESALISVGMVENLLKNFELKAHGNRVVIITNADLMNEPAANKLLKTFEEVPPNTYFILTAGSRHTLLPTVRSRSTCFFVPFLSDDEITKVLKAYGYFVKDEGVLEFACGSAGKAMLALDSNYSELKEKISVYARHALNGDASAAILSMQSVDKNINTVAFFLEGLAQLLLKNEALVKGGVASGYIQSINFLLQAMLAKKFPAEQAIQNMALRLAQKAI